MSMSEKDARFWAERRFTREMAAEVHMEFVREEVGHEPYRTETKEEWAKRMEGHDESDDEGKVKRTPKPVQKVRPWSGPLPRPAELFKRAAERVGYETVAGYSHQHRIGAHDRYLAVPSADVCTLHCRRGGEYFQVAWADLDGKWTFETSLDFSPHEGIIPQIRKINALKKERLT